MVVQRSAESVAALALAAWRAPIDDIPPESPADVDWDCYRDCWTDGFETGYKAAQAALIDGDECGDCARNPGLCDTHDGRGRTT